MMNDEFCKEIVRYEYKVLSTPHYTDYIEESWDLHKVFNSWLQNGCHNFILVFRRRETKNE